MITNQFLKVSLLLTLIVSSLSCQKSNDTTNQFAGRWKGTYTGANDNGSWDVTVDANGSVTGIATSTVYVEDFTTVGTVNGSSGQITLTIGSASSGAVFNGTLSGTSASGTWVNNSHNPPFTGTWSGNKQ